MGLDRDELAARLAVALAGRSDQFSSISLADDAVTAADALISRLRPATVAPVADAAPRPEWVRIKEGPGWYAPFVRKVVRWVGDCPAVYAARGNDVDLETGEAPITLESADWEPCAAPAPSPAAAPDHPSEARRGQGAAGDQRVAAGLDAPAKPAVDREGLAKALRGGMYTPEEIAAYPWESLHSECRNDYLKSADAAIRFLGGAS